MAIDFILNIIKRWTLAKHIDYDYMGFEIMTIWVLHDNTCIRK